MAHIRIKLNGETMLVQPETLRQLLATEPSHLGLGNTEYNKHYEEGLLYGFQSADIKNGRVSISVETIETEAGMHSRVLICTVNTYNAVQRVNSVEHVLNQTQFKFAITDEAFIKQLVLAKSNLRNTGEWRF